MKAMTRRALLITAVFILALATLPRRGATSAATSVKVDSQLTQFFATHAPGATVPVVITYRQRPGAAELARLQLAGIAKGFAARELPMVICDMSAAQLNLVSKQPGVASTYFFTLSEVHLGVVLALFCGFFLYIGASDLLPESHHRHPKALTGLMNIAGATVIWLAIHFAS